MRLSAGNSKAIRRPTLFYIYPEGNWIEATADSPYFILGRTLYGKPILDRLLISDTPLAQALALAYLAFDATRTSVIDVAFPIDVIIFDPLTRSFRNNASMRPRWRLPRMVAAVFAGGFRRISDGLGEITLANVSPTKSD